MRVLFRATADFLARVRCDLARPHQFADERVGFIAVRATAGAEHLVLLAESYHPVADRDYIPDFTIGARIGQDAVRKALEIALLHSTGVFHVHAHFSPGRLWFSAVDLREQHLFVPDFFSVCGAMPHGALVVNQSEVAGRVWLSKSHVEIIDEFDVVGTRIHVASGVKGGGVDVHA